MPILTPDSHARFAVAGYPSAVAGRSGAPAQPGAALRGSDGEGGRLGLHQARPGGGRGTGGGGARFRGLRGRGRRLGRGAPGQGPGPGSAGREQQVGRDRGRATSGWPEKCRPADRPGPEPRRLEGMLLLTSRRRLRVRPLRAEDACPRVRKLGDEDRQLRERRRTKERTDGGPRVAGGERERPRAGGGGRAGSDVRDPERPAGSSWRQSRPRARAHTRSSATIAQERVHAPRARRLTNHCRHVEHHGNSGAIKDRVAILYSPNHSSFKQAGRGWVRLRGFKTPPQTANTSRKVDLPCLILRVRTDRPNPGRPYGCAVRSRVTVHPVGRWPVMAEPWSGQFLQALPATVLGAMGTLGSEFLREWETQDMRVTLFKLLLLWLVLSLLGIQLAWGFYGNTVTGLYHRPGEAPYEPP